MADTNTVNTLERIANLLRIHSIESTQESNSGYVRKSFLFSIYLIYI